MKNRHFREKLSAWLFLMAIILFWGGAILAYSNLYGYRLVYILAAVAGCGLAALAVYVYESDYDNKE